TAVCSSPLSSAVITIKVSPTYSLLYEKITCLPPLTYSAHNLNKFLSVRHGNFLSLQSLHFPIHKKTATEIRPTGS
ncbi:hypothetical protein K6U28_20195, partial [Vibrio parahaemolyticus]|nr:hypothetical protein [Vibrio parahaemolyticus]